MRVLPRSNASLSAWVCCAAVVTALGVHGGWAQTEPAAAAQPAAESAPATAADPLAIVPIDASNPGGAATVTGALEVAGGKAMIGAGGSVTSGTSVTQVVLPHRGVLRVCAATTVRLAADSSVPAGDTPGLLMAIDHGAMEMSFATTPAAGSNADVVLTPDFRILIAGPGSSDLKVRLGEGGDTCVDNTGANAPYVVVTSLFDPGLYRVQPGQRVMFQHGSLNEVVDSETEPCGCPAHATSEANEFPLAQSEGLAPTPAPAPAPAQPASQPAAKVAPLVYPSNPPGNAETAPAAAPPAQAAPAAAPAANSAASPAAEQTAAPAKEKKPGLFRRVGRFFRRIFGAE
jgi:hypothetical protein